jgi:phage terminase large subunit-like protein
LERVDRVGRPRFQKDPLRAEWVPELVETRVVGRVALIAPTAGDARDVMVDRPAGLLPVSSVD